MSVRNIPSSLTREMGLDLNEFTRLLPVAVEPHRYSVEGRCFTVHHPADDIRICLQQTGRRTIAMLSLPVTPVSFDFGTLDESARAAFMLRFDRYFHRGGG